MSRYYYKILAIIAINVASLLVSSCGFTPVYQSSGENETLIPPISITPINSVDGAEFYHHLSKIIGDTSSAQYTLNASLAYSGSNLIIEKLSDVTEVKSIQTVTYTLIDNQTHQTASSGAFNVSGHYNSVYSPYASSIEERQSKENLARQAAEVMHTKLIIYFSKINKK